MRNYQISVDAGTLYEVRWSGRGSEQVRPNISCVGGTVNVYGAQVANASPPSGMSIIDGMSDVTLSAFEYIPNFMYIEVASGSPDIIVSGLATEEYIELFPLFTELGGFLNTEDGEQIYA